MSAKLALIWSKMYFQQDSLSFLPLALRFMAQAWAEIKILRQFLAEKMIYVLRPSGFSIFEIVWTSWRFSGWISAKLALIWSKMHLQPDSLPFLLLATRFMTFRLGMG